MDDEFQVVAKEKKFSVKVDILYGGVSNNEKIGFGENVGKIWKFVHCGLKMRK